VSAFRIAPLRQLDTHELTALLDQWLARMLAPHRIKQTIIDLNSTQEDPALDAGLLRARAGLAECATKLNRHRAALEAGADPATVAQWIAETNNERALAEAVVRTTSAGVHPQLIAEEIEKLVGEIGDLVRTLQKAEPADRQEAYRQLGIRLTYDPAEHQIRVELTFNTEPHRIGAGALPAVKMAHALNMGTAQ
jgi:hypothetical protein